MPFFTHIWQGKAWVNMEHRAKKVFHCSPMGQKVLRGSGTAEADISDEEGCERRGQGLQAKEGFS